MTSKTAERTEGLRVGEMAATSTAGTQRSGLAGAERGSVRTGEAAEEERIGGKAGEAYDERTATGGDGESFGAMAELKRGETVLVMGASDAGDLLAAAKRVGPKGKVYGVALRDETGAPAGNIELLKSATEGIPWTAQLADHAVDVVTGRCFDRSADAKDRSEDLADVLADKEQAMREMFRVLAPGGRLAVCDVVRRGEMPVAMRESARLQDVYARAIEENDYRLALLWAGFDQIQIEPLETHRAEAAEVDGKFMSAAIRAVKPFRSRGECGCTCCG